MTDQQLTWVEKVDRLKSQLGRNPTLEELIELSRGHVLTESEIRAQAESWVRQTMD